MPEALARRDRCLESKPRDALGTQSRKSHRRGCPAGPTVDWNAFHAHRIEDRTSIACRVGHRPARHPIGTTAAGPVIPYEPYPKICGNTDC